MKLGQDSTVAEAARVEFYPCEETLHGLFSANAISNPDKPAVVMDDVRLTYGEVERVSNALAGRLAGLGVGRGDRVGLLSHRDPDAVIAMLATLKLGACFVPLDPAYPSDRIRMMVEDAAPKVVLVQEAAVALAHAPTDLGVSVLGLESTVKAAAADPEAYAPPAVGRADDAAYVIFTSGSTGRPKGVIGTHRGVVRIVWRYEVIGLDQDTVSLNIVAPSFDPCQIEIWGALANGGTLAILPDPTPALNRIGEAIVKYKATFTIFATGMFHLMVDNRLDDLAPLKSLLAGGDVLSPKHANRAAAALPGTRIINAYGPTENGIMTTSFEVPPEGWREGSIPIGFPVRGTETFILDENLQQVADGEVGQLCAAGDGLAAGYFGRPDLTAEKFVRNPFSDDPTARMYLTGDLVRRRPDGGIEFVGRNDRQVKINNKRVELDEIENIVRADSRLADAVVVLREDEPGAPRLAAYLKPNARVEPAERSAFADAVAVSLRESLPAHMQPADLVVMDVFPLTEAGKVDRKALPRPIARSGAPNGHRPAAVIAASDTEQVIAEIWREVLRLPAVGVDENFFDLGGTSMQLVRVHAEVQNRLGSDVSLVTFFEMPKIRELAAYLGRGAPTPDVGTGVASKVKADRRSEALARARNQRARAGR